MLPNRSRGIWSTRDIWTGKGGLLFIGPEAERRFGHRHFVHLTAVFTAPPQFTVLHGRSEIGRTDPSLLTERVNGPRRLLLGGRSRLVTYIDWRRKRCFVEPVDGGGKAKWSSAGFGPGASFEVSRAGHRANATLAATLDELAVPGQRINDHWIRLREDVTPASWKSLTGGAADRLCLPAVDERAVRGLKFAEALPPRLAEATLSARLAGLGPAVAVLAEPVRFVSIAGP